MPVVAFNLPNYPSEDGKEFVGVWEDLTDAIDQSIERRQSWLINDCNLKNGKYGERVRIIRYQDHDINFKEEVLKKFPNTNVYRMNGMTIDGEWCPPVWNGSVNPRETEYIYKHETEAGCWERIYNKRVKES